MRYDFEKLEVYRQALDFTDQIFEMTDALPQRVQFSLGDQLRRASLSICNNIAEGSQKRGPAKRLFYGYALDSARECVPMLELSRRRTFINQGQYEQLNNSCYSIARMMYALIQSVR